MAIFVSNFNSTFYLTSLA